MNRWQIVFIIFGVAAVAILFVFPPQFTMGTVQFLPFIEGYPIDWLRLLFWIVAVIIAASLGFAANKQEHR